jgi:hypothetical protein
MDNTHTSQSRPNSRDQEGRGWGVPVPLSALLSVCIFLVVLGFELGASHFLGGCSGCLNHFASMVLLSGKIDSFTPQAGHPWGRGRGNST